MTSKRKTWTFFDENDNYLFMAEELAKWKPTIGHIVRVGGVNYSIWYIEDGKGVHNVRMERAPQ